MVAEFLSFKCISYCKLSGVGINISSVCLIEVHGFVLYHFFLEIEVKLQFSQHGLDI